MTRIILAHKIGDLQTHGLVLQPLHHAIDIAAISTVSRIISRISPKKELLELTISLRRGLFDVIILHAAVVKLVRLP